MRLATRVKLLLSVGCLLALSPTARGQAVYGSIFGTVTDSTGAIVPNAAVTVTDVAKGTSVSEVSNGSGEFTADHLIPDISVTRLEGDGVWFTDFITEGISGVCRHRNQDAGCSYNRRNSR